VTGRRLEYLSNRETESKRSRTEGQWEREMSKLFLSEYSHFTFLQIKKSTVT